MSETEKIRKAQEVIGNNEDNDYIINPTGHSELYSNQTPEFAQILDSSEVSMLAEEYERYDQMALKAQSLFLKQSKHARWAVLWAASFSAGLVSAGSWSSIDSPDGIISKIILTALAVGSVLAGTYAGICLQQIRAKKLLEKWMEARSEAESTRLGYFEAVVTQKTDIEETSETTLSLLRLEYFRRYQLDVQVNYLEDRIGRLGERSSSRLTYIAYILGGVTAINGIAGILGWADPKWAALAAVALIGQAFGAMLSNDEAVNQDSRNAERYGRTLAALKKIKAELDNVRIGVSRNKKELLHGFLEAVQEPISSEHQQWVKDFEKRSKALGRLWQQLEKLKEGT